MRTYDDFKAEILRKLEADIPDPKDITVHFVQKMNHDPQEAITIMEGDAGMSPTIYVGEFYQMYQACGDLDAVYGNILEVYRENKDVQLTTGSFFTEFDNVKPNITMRLVNYKKNEELLKEVPHLKYLDLAVVFYIIPFRTEDGIAGVLVRHNMMELWGKETEDLYKVAEANTKRLFPSSTMELCRMINTLNGEPMVGEDVPDGVPPMYVAINSTGMFGAIEMFFKERIAEIAEKHQSDVFVLPSSVHELILVPMTKDAILAEMSEMVQTVNAAEVDDSEFLSDHAYYYSRETGNITY